LQFSQTVPEEKKKAARILASSTSRNVKEYIEKFRGALAGNVLNSMKYSFSVFLVPKVANRQSAADVAVQFVRVDEASEEELTRLEKLNVLIREKQIPIANLGWFKPGEVVQEICKRLPYEITVNAHTNAWKFYKVRPVKGDPHPERTRPEYCVYDDAHEDYVYTPAWVEKLVQAFSNKEEFEKIVGHAPQPRKDAA
jgi:hypothetical protein